jgi:hypothetical protein
LGAGFLAKVYERALVRELALRGMKCVDRFANEHLAQCINYLKVSGLRVALRINF